MPGVIDGIDEVGGALDGLAVSWVDDLSDDALLGSLAAVERHRRVLDATVMHLVAEADARSVSDRTAGLATSTWISREGRQSFGTARRKVIVARALAERFDEVDAAMVKGEIGFEHAWVIVNTAHPRIADAMEAMQDQLLRLAAGRTFTAWRREVERIAALLDDRPPAERDADVGSNRLSFGRDPDGSVSLRGRFVGSWAETIEHVLPTIADQLVRGFQADHAACPELVVPDRESVMALAFEEACRRAMACDAGTETAPTTDATIVIPVGPPPDPLDPVDPNRNAPRWFTGLDALDASAGDILLDGASMTDAFTSGCTADGSALGATSLDPARLPHWFPTGTASNGRGRPVADDVARLLACDPALHSVIVDTLGRPLDVGTSTRFATPRLRRGAHTRDGGCVFPGCEIRPAWTDLHHVVPFPTGPTDLDNLACLCRHHHRVSHRHGWSMHATDDGWFWWRTPIGRSFWSQRHGCQRVEPPP